MSKSFDRVAGVYDLLAKLVFGKSIKQAQIHLFPHIPKGGRILIVGGGTGWILPPVLAELQPEKVVYVDISPKMIQSAREQLQAKAPEWKDKVQFIQDTGDADFLSAPVDVVITPFFLDVFPPDQLPRVAERLRAALKSGGYWSFTDFRYPPNGFFRFYAKLLIPTMYFFFRFLTGVEAKKLPDFVALFKEIGMELQTEEFFYGKLIRTAVYTKP